MKRDRVKTVFRYECIIVALFLLFFVLVIVNINSGTVSIPAKEIIRIILLRIRDESVESNIIWKIRLPRILLAAILGGALSVSGFLLQTFFRNPIAGPFVLGISSGAKMAVGFVMIIALQYWKSVPSSVMVAAAFVGSLLVMGMVLLFSQRIGSMVHAARHRHHGQLHMFCDYGFLHNLRKGDGRGQPYILVHGQLFRRLLEQC